MRARWGHTSPVGRHLQALISDKGLSVPRTPALPHCRPADTTSLSKPPLITHPQGGWRQSQEGCKAGAPAPRTHLANPGTRARGPTCWHPLGTQSRLRKPSSQPRALGLHQPSGTRAAPRVVGDPGGGQGLRQCLPPKMGLISLF